MAAIALHIPWVILFSWISVLFLKNASQRSSFCADILQEQAWLPRLLGIKANPLLNPTMTLNKPDISPPPLWIIHSEQDSVVSSRNLIAIPHALDF